jgi:hypothetical protein
VEGSQPKPQWQNPGLCYFGFNTNHKNIEMSANDYHFDTNQNQFKTSLTFFDF